MPVTDISPARARELQQNGCLLIDVREPAEWATGMAEGELAKAMPT